MGADLGSDDNARTADAEVRSAGAGARAGTRVLTDPREMRALAHPVRMALLDALRRHGSLTATEAGELLEETPANCSFHLRTLAKYGYVEEAPGGTGRRRPWRRTTVGMSYALEQDTPEAAAAVAELDRHFRRREEDELAVWEQTRQSYPQPWVDAAFEFRGRAFLTAAEMNALSEQIVQLIEAYRDRMDSPENRPPDAQMVSLHANGFPLPATPSLR